MIQNPGQRLSSSLTMQMHKYGKRGKVSYFKVYIFSFIFLVTGCQSAFCNESSFLLSNNGVEILQHSAVLEILALQKKVAACKKDRNVPLTRYKSAKDPLEKRFWLSLLIEREIVRLNTLAKAYTIVHNQDKVFAEQYDKIRKNLSNPRIKEELSGLNAMYVTLFNQKSDNTVKSGNIKSLLTMVQYQFTQPTESEKRFTTPVKHDLIISELSNQLVLLKKYYTRITQGELI